MRMEVGVLFMYHKIKIGFLILIIFVCMSLLGCNRRVDKIDIADNEFIKVYSEVKFKEGTMYEIIDSETGVHYLMYVRFKNSVGGSITPRLNSDGSVMCDK